MKILYATIDSVQEGVGSSQILPTVLEIHKKGVQITLLSFEKIQPKQELEDLLKNSGVTWVYFQFSKFHFIDFLRRMIIIWNHSRKYDVVHARGDIPALAAIFTRAKVLWDFRSFWASQRKNMETSRLKRLFFYLFQFFEPLMFYFSNGISTLTFAAIFTLESKYKSKKKSIVVPTHVDLNLFAYNKKLPDTLTCLLSGTYNSLYDVEHIETLIHHFQNITDGKTIWAKPTESSSFFKSIPNNNINTFSREDLPALISNSSFGVALCKKVQGNSLKGACPTKIAEFLAVGRPVFVSEGLGDFDFLIQSYKIGIVVPHTGPKLEHVEEMLKLLADDQTPIRCRYVAENYFSLQVGIEKYISLYSNL
jgi:glycosyltransferase involved in cell wall biosynthesis